MNKILVLQNNCFELVDYDGKLETLQNLVGGYIECPSISSEFNRNNICVIMNEEGKYTEGLEPSIAIIDEKGNILDICMGNILFTGLEKDEYGDFNFSGISKEQIDVVEKELEQTVIIRDKIFGRNTECRLLVIK